MKFASLKSDNPDGSLVLVAKQLNEYVEIHDIAPTMQYALDNWDRVKDSLAERYQRLNRGEEKTSKPFVAENTLAPLPRAWQWLDGSLFLSHGHFMQKAFHMDPIEGADVYPLVYQGAGNMFLASTDDIVVGSLEYGVDFEGEFGVIVDDVPMGSSAQECLSKIRLIVLLNDISYRTLAPREMKTGFGFVQGKGATAFAPVAITPDELGASWQNGRVHLTLDVSRNGQFFGCPSGAEMHFGFHDLIAYVAKTRDIKAGTVLGSGTVSNQDPSAGQACISELRAKEMIKSGEPQTQFMNENETVRMNVLDNNGQTVFGVIEQSVKVSQSNV